MIYYTSEVKAKNVGVRFTCPPNKSSLAGGSNPKGENDQLLTGLINQAPTMKFENKSLNLG